MNTTSAGGSRNYTVAFLASDAASFITGQTMVVHGGFLASGVNS